MDTRIEKFTRAFFWVGYVVFLSASIPHVASYFRHFDPATTNQFEDISYWIIAVAIAVVIDVSDVLVSIAVIRAKANGTKGKDTWLFWVFIFLIMALSWLFNWQYNVVFGTSEFQAVDKYTIVNNVTIGQVNPIIGSAFQLLILVYTLMAHKFAQKPKERTLDELMKEADEVEQKADYLARIDTVKQAQASRKWQARFEGIRQVKDEAIKTIKGQDEAVLEETKPSDEISPEAEADEPITQPIIEELLVTEDEQTEEDTAEHNMGDNDEDNDLIQVLESYPKVSSEWLAKGRKSASIDEIITVTGQNKRRLNKANLQRSSRNKDLILISSVLEWLKTVPLPSEKTEQKPRNTDELPATNGHKKVTQPLDNLVPMEV